MPLPSAESALADVRAGGRVIGAPGWLAGVGIGLVGVLLLAVAGAVLSVPITRPVSVGQAVFLVVIALVIGIAGVVFLVGWIRILFRPSRIVLHRSGVSEQVRRHGSWESTGSLSWSDYEEFSEHVQHLKWPTKVRRTVFRLTPQAWSSISGASTDTPLSRQLRLADRALLGERTLMMNPLYGRSRRLAPILQALHAEYGRPG